MKAYKIFAIIFAVIALIGLIRFVSKTTPVNAGAFIFPAAMAVIFAFVYLKKKER